MLLESQPNIDFFSREELRNVIRKFKQDVHDGKIEDVSHFELNFLEFSQFKH